MKKFFLSAIVMLGVCGIASAQTGAKQSKQPASTSAAVAATPQKAAIMAESDMAPTAPAQPTTSDDKNAAANRSATQTAQKADATKVNAAGEVVPTDDAKRREAKMAAVKAANAAPQGKQN